MSDERDDVIIVGMDGSAPAYNALTWAIREAKSIGWPIRLVGAYSVPNVAAATIDVSYVPIDDEAIRESVTQVLKEAAAFCSRNGVDVEAIIEIGDAAGVLVEESKRARLAVVGSRGRGGFAGRLLGTVSSALPAHSSCPTVVVPTTWQEGAVHEPQETSSRRVRTESGSVAEDQSDSLAVTGPDFSGSVVAGVDSLGRKSPALWSAARLANRTKRPLTLVAVMTTTVVGPEWLPSTVDSERYVTECSDRLDACVATLAEAFPELPVRWSLFDGSPAEALVRASDTADVLVLGSRGRGGFAGLLLGSTSQSVLPYSQCPTMVVRVPKDARNDLIVPDQPAGA